MTARSRGALSPEEQCVMDHRHDPSIPYYPGPDEYRGPDWGRTFASMCSRCSSVIYKTLDDMNKVCNRRYLYSGRYRRLLDTRPDRDELRWRHLRAYKREMAASVAARQKHAAERIANRGRKLRAVK